MKQALAILNSPKALCDFFWFYLEYGQNYEWDVLVRRCCILSEGWLEKTEIFKTIYVDEVDLDKKNVVYLLFLFSKMFIYMLLNRRVEFAKKTIKSKTQGKEYDLYVVHPYGNSVFPGLVYLQGKEKEVVILEDGSGDYNERRNKWEKTNPHNMIYFASYILAKMGYSDFTYQYVIKSMSDCIKCATFPEKLKYTAYKEIRKIGVFSGDNKNSYDELIEKTFPFEAIEGADAVLYTAPFTDFTEDENLLSNIVGKTEEYINEHYAGRKIILKRHPRDKQQYEFNSNVEVVEVDPVVPGELIEYQMDKKGQHDVLLMFPSTILQSISKDGNISIFYYERLDSIPLKAPYRKIFSETVSNLSIQEKNIVAI